MNSKLSSNNKPGFESKINKIQPIFNQTYQDFNSKNSDQNFNFLINKNAY